MMPLLRRKKKPEGQSPYGANHKFRREVKLGKRCAEDSRKDCIWGGTPHKCRVVRAR